MLVEELSTASASIPTASSAPAETPVPVVVYQPDPAPLPYFVAPWDLGKLPVNEKERQVEHYKQMLQIIAACITVGAFIVSYIKTRRA